MDRLVLYLGGVVLSDFQDMITPMACVQVVGAMANATDIGSENPLCLRDRALRPHIVGALQHNYLKLRAWNTEWTLAMR